MRQDGTQWWRTADQRQMSESCGGAGDRVSKVIEPSEVLDTTVGLMKGKRENSGKDKEG